VAAVPGDVSPRLGEEHSQSGIHDNCTNRTGNYCTYTQQPCRYKTNPNTPIIG
jgi:hypothetical protein